MLCALAWQFAAEPKELDRGLGMITVGHNERIRHIADRGLWLEDGQFRDEVEVAIGPVCGRSADRQCAPAQVTHDGHVLCFCDRGCRDVFLEDPQRFWESYTPASSKQPGQTRARLL